MIIIDNEIGWIMACCITNFTAFACGFGCGLAVKHFQGPKQ
jgi:hypothetical protein